MTTPHNSQGKISIDHTTLRSASYAFNSPFDLPLAEGQVLSADEIVRIVPGKRMVVFGTWLGKKVAAKLFFAPRHAKRHQEDDKRGMKLLQTNKVPSPELYYEGQGKDAAIYVLVYERILDAMNLDTLWQTKKHLNDVLPVLKQVMIELATHHVLGMEQQDLHLKNFLITEKKIYTIDGAQIKWHARLLGKETSIENLALFLAQLGAGLDHLVRELFIHYAKSRGWRLKPQDFMSLLSHMKRINVGRWKQYDKKIFRNSSDFAQFQQHAYSGMFVRSYLRTDLLRFMHDPETFLLSHPHTLLKDGNSSTVYKLTLDGKDVVVKRYNLKNTWHFLRRCLRHTRARLNWRFAHKMKLFNITTPPPILFLEKTTVGLKSTSYYVSEYLDSQNAQVIFTASDEASLHAIIDRIAQLFKSLLELEMTHGDLKITNFLFDEHNQPVLVDFDGAEEHASLSSLRRHWRKDIRRFMENFSSQPELKQRFEVELKTLL